MAAARWTTTRRNLGSRCFCFKKYQNAHKSGSSFLCSFCDGRNGRECLESVWRCGGVEVLYP